MQENIDIVRSIYEAFNAKEIDRLASLGVPDAKVTVMPFHEETTLWKYTSRFANAFPDGKIEVVRFTSGDKRVACEYIGTGTHTGPLHTPEGVLNPTGLKVELRMCEIFEINDAGKVSALCSYFDSADLLRQLGQPAGLPAAAMKPAPQPEVRT